MPFSRRSKYNVDNSEAGKERRRFLGRLYNSLAEMRHAQKLEAMRVSGAIDFWLRQTGFDLGEDIRYRADFVVGHPDADGYYVFAVDVKGADTPAFRRVRRLWPKYGPFDLHVVRRGNTVEVIEPDPNRLLAG